MKTRFKILFVFVLLSFSLSIMSNTYSRYITDTTGDIEMVFAKWQILVNNEDITQGNTNSVEITPTLLENENIAQNKLAPTSEGYYDIVIDPSNVDVSFNYTLSIAKNVEMEDLIIDKYTIINEDSDLDNLEYTNIEDNTITNSLDIVAGQSFEAFTIRVHFIWYDENDNEMTDEEDTTFVQDNENITIQTNIAFEQKLD
jgi:hypothetical protein